MISNSLKSLIAFVVLSFFILMLIYFYSGNSGGARSQQEAPVNITVDTTKQIQSKRTESVLRSFKLNSNDAISFPLLPILREISGLAVTPNGDIFTHNDEDGIIFKLDPLDGSVLSTFEMTVNGKRVQDDLEGIAIAEENMFVINSNGKIYMFEPVGNGEKANCRIYPTSLAVDWEIEGLAYDPTIRSLVIISKNPLTAKASGKVGIFFWSLDKRALLLEDTIYIPIHQLADKIGQKKFQPSGIERHPESGHYLIIAARQHSIAEITPQGELLAIQKLAGKLHHQMEGITVLTDKGLLISDEGGNKSGRLTFYPLN